MTIKVFADFFHDEKAISFLDDGWDSMQIGGVTKVLQKQSIVCKLTISSQNFTCNFHYTRYHKVATSKCTPLDMDLNSYQESASISFFEVYHEDTLITLLNTFDYLLHRLETTSATRKIC